MYEFDYLVKHHYNEMLKEAEKYRLISKVNHSQDHSFPYISKGLAWIGSRMCTLGSLLEDRFGEQNPIPHSQSVD